MTAFFFASGMQTFFAISTSFPTAIFTVLVLVVLGYWLLAILGAVDISVLDVEIDLDADPSTMSALAGFIMRLGLHGVPFTIVISLISFSGWLISYYLVYFLQGIVHWDFLRWLIGVPILLGSFYIAAMLTAVIIRPLRPLFKRVEQQTVKRVLGQVAVVRSTLVDSRSGEATLADGGAGLILKVRTRGDLVFRRGDRVVLLEYIPEQYFYHVISEEEFLGPSLSK